MKVIIAGLILLCAFVALFCQSLSFSRKISFMGSIILSLSLGLLLWLNHGNYLVVLVTFFMLLADLAVYFFGRSFALLPLKEKPPSSITRLYRASVLFFLASWTFGVSAIIWRTNLDHDARNNPAEQAIQGLHSLLWGDGFLYITVIAALILVSSFGIFFMAKKET